MLAGEVDVAVHPPHHHPLDPYADGRLVTRRTGDSVEVVQADRQILLDCGLLWDIVANQHVFGQMGIVLRPPVPKLDMQANFNIAPLAVIAGLNFPTNRPDMENRYPMCQHWTLTLTVGSKTIAYRIGAYRPSIGAMEADRQ
jgi:hypothetical protein